MLKYLIPLFALLLMPIAHADTSPKPSYTKTMYSELNEAVSSRGLFDDSISVDTERLSRSSKITLTKNYPIVPYDPNHPNVKKQSKFTISPKAKTLAGRFGRGLNAVALGFAVADMVGEGIDWVLDPDNNSVRYTNPDEKYCNDNICESSPEYLCNRLANRAKASESARYQTSVSAVMHDVTETTCTILIPEFYNPIAKADHPDYYHEFRIEKRTKGEEQELSLDAIAQHVINNENVTNNITNNITNVYNEAVTDTLVEQIEKGEHDDAIKEAVKQIENDKTDDKDKTKQDEETKDKDKDKKDEDTGQLEDEETNTKFPKFCDWAKPVCDWIEWSKEPLEDEDTKLHIPDQQSDSIDTSINASGSCPTDIVIQGTFAGRQFEFFRFQWSKFCQWLFIIKPIIIAMASFGAAKIVGGVNVAD